MLATPLPKTPPPSSNLLGRRTLTKLIGATPPTLCSPIATFHAVFSLPLLDISQPPLSLPRHFDLLFRRPNICAKPKVATSFIVRRPIPRGAPYHTIKSTCQLAWAEDSHLQTNRRVALLVAILYVINGKSYAYSHRPVDELCKGEEVGELRGEKKLNINYFTNLNPSLKLY